MDWTKLFSKLKLIDIKVNSDADQVGIVNIQIEQHNYYYNVSDPEAVKAGRQNKITPEIEDQIKKQVQKILTPVIDTFGMLSESTAQEFLAATTATATITVIKKL